MAAAEAPSGERAYSLVSANEPEGLPEAEGQPAPEAEGAIFDGCLDMFTYAEWERQSNEIYNKLNIAFNRDHARFWREYMRDRAVVEPDAKLGRISIPRKLLDSIGVTKEVVFSGSDFKIEIWSKEAYEASGLSNDVFLAIAGQLSQQR